MVERFGFRQLLIFLNEKEREKNGNALLIKIPFQLRPLQHDVGTSKLPLVPW